MEVKKFVMNESFLVDDRIPVRNVWFLFLYANDLAKFSGRFDAEIEDSPNIKTLIARLLCHVVELRLKRNLSFGFQRRRENLSRIRGKIDVLKTLSHNLLQQGKIACSFEDMTVDTPRNRFVRAALAELSKILEEKHTPGLSEQSKYLARVLEQAGVSTNIPSRSDLAADQIARHESDDKLMVSLAHAVFDLILPTETKGNRSLLFAMRNEVDFPRIFETAIGNFYKSYFSRNSGWEVYPRQWINWNVGSQSLNFQSFLPLMQTDIVLENSLQMRKIVIDTKFTNVFGQSRFNNQKRFRSTNIYQIYTYIRSQENSNDSLSSSAEGVLLYPTIGEDINEAAEIDGHIFRFVTVDLSKPTEEIIKKLQGLPIQVPEIASR